MTAMLCPSQERYNNSIDCILEHQQPCQRVRFLSTIELVNALEQEKQAGTQGGIANRLIHTDLVILDELGYLPISQVGSPAVPPDQ